MSHFQYFTTFCVLLTVLGVAWSHPADETNPSDPEQHKLIYDNGTLSQEFLQANPKFDFLGTINSKKYYIERTKATFNNANSGCTSLGMQLAKFDSTSELTFVQNSLLSGDGLPWVGASLKYVPASFQWTDGSALYSSASMTTYITVGLVLFDPTYFAVQNGAVLNYYLCYT